MNYSLFVLGSSKTLLGLSLSNTPSVIQAGKTNPNKKNNTQNANPPNIKNSATPKPLILITKIL